MTYHKNSLRIKISNVGVAKIFDGGGGANRKSHAMTASEILKKWDFYETEIPYNGRSRAGTCVCGT